MTGHEPFSPEAWGDRLAERGPSSRPAPAGERLEPVEPGQLREGPYVVTARVDLDDELNVSYMRNGRRFSCIDHADDFPDATWQRVVADPPLPTTPGRVIRCEIESLSSGAHVAESYLPREVRELLWSVAGFSHSVRSDRITRMLYVYPEPGEERA